MSNRRAAQVSEKECAMSAARRMGRTAVHELKNRHLFSRCGDAKSIGTLIIGMGLPISNPKTNTKFRQNRLHHIDQGIKRWLNE